MCLWACMAPWLLGRWPRLARLLLGLGRESRLAPWLLGRWSRLAPVLLGLGRWSSLLVARRCSRLPPLVIELEVGASSSDASLSPFKTWTLFTGSLNQSPRRTLRRLDIGEQRRSDKKVAFGE